MSQPLHEDFRGQVSAVGQNQGLVSTGETAVLIQAASCHMLAATYQHMQCLSLERWKVAPLIQKLQTLGTDAKSLE